MNPSFNPLPPLSDVIKTKIFNAYTLNLVSSPNTTDSIVVRAVSLKFGVGMERVRAIIRLKELEKSWKDQVRCDLAVCGASRGRVLMRWMGFAGSDFADGAAEGDGESSWSQDPRGALERHRATRSRVDDRAVQKPDRL